MASNRPRASDRKKVSVKQQYRKPKKELKEEKVKDRLQSP
jgi:hypothetical protein